MYKKIVLPFVLIIVVFSVPIFLLGINQSIQFSDNKKISEVEISDSNSVNKTKKPGEYRILMLGDSIGLGSGDQSGSDIGSYYKRMQTTEDDEISIETVNLAVNGAKIKDLLNEIEKEQTKALIKSSDLIIISIGGNDMKTILDSSNLNLLIDYQELAQMYEETLKSIFNEISKIKFEGQVAIIGLYNPFSEDISLEKIQVLLDWNHLTRSIIENYKKIAFIETYELFKYNKDKYLAIDEFHPNALGYKAISRQLLLVIEGLEE